MYNQPYSYQFSTLENQQSVIWTVAPTDRLPVGLNLTPDGLLTGIPAETGPFAFTVRANNTTAKVGLTIDSGSLNTWSVVQEPPIPANVAVPFTHLLLAPGGATFSLSSGDLPPGLALSANGLITGTPTTAGLYMFTVHLETNYADGFGVAAVTIRVGAIQAENRMLPGGVIGAPYSAQLRGGSVAPGDSLPAGLTLSPDGRITGVPAAPWFYQFSVLLNESPGDVVTSTYTLEVVP